MLHLGPFDDSLDLDRVVDHSDHDYSPAASWTEKRIGRVERLEWSPPVLLAKANPQVGHFAKFSRSGIPLGGLQFSLLGFGPTLSGETCDL